MTLSAQSAMTAPIVNPHFLAPPALTTQTTTIATSADGNSFVDLPKPCFQCEASSNVSMNSGMFEFKRQMTKDTDCSTAASMFEEGSISTNENSILSVPSAVSIPDSSTSAPEESLHTTTILSNDRADIPSNLCPDLDVSTVVNGAGGLTINSLPGMDPHSVARLLLSNFIMSGSICEDRSVGLFDVQKMVSNIVCVGTRFPSATLQFDACCESDSPLLDCAQRAGITSFFCQNTSQINKISQCIRTPVGLTVDGYLSQTSQSLESILNMRAVDAVVLHSTRQVKIFKDIINTGGIIPVLQIRINNCTQLVKGLQECDWSNALSLLADTAVRLRFSINISKFSEEALRGSFTKIQELTTRFNIHLDTVGISVENAENDLSVCLERTEIIMHMISEYWQYSKVELDMTTAILKPCEYVATRIFARRYSSQNDDRATPVLYYIPDGIYGSFANKIMRGKEFRPSVLLGNQSTSPRNAKVFGQTCDGLDCVSDGCELPLLEVGDWLLWDDMGGSTYQTQFNGFEPRSRVYCQIMP